MTIDSTQANDAAFHSKKDWPSVDDAHPDEEGGPVARSGFKYQDEIAVSILLDMLEDPSILRVHCETHDDILVVRALPNAEEHCAEYIQVKASQPDKLWSVADLCARKNAKVGTSIFEKSLSRDKHKEISRFRLVTLRPVVSDLEVLTLELAAVGREPDCEPIKALCEQLEKKCPGAKSDKGNTHAFWLDNCHWDVRHDEGSVQENNLVRVLGLSKAGGAQLLMEAAQTLLDELRAQAKAAGAAKWVPDKEKKIFFRADLKAWWDKRVAELTQKDGLASGGRLAEKMDAAALPDDQTRLAIDLRRRYSEELRAPRYLEAADIEPLLDRVKSEAMTLRAHYISGEIDESSAAFHTLCLQRMDAINGERPDGTPDRSAFLKGCLYDIADRCLLRFERPGQ